MGQCGWNLWRGSKSFKNLERLIAFAERQVNKAGGSFAGLTVMIGYNDCDDGSKILRTIDAWQDSVLEQVQHESQHWEPLWGPRDDPDW